jgi:hypothetical protein
MAVPAGRARRELTTVDPSRPNGEPLAKGDKGKAGGIRVATDAFRRGLFRNRLIGETVFGACLANIQNFKGRKRTGKQQC